MGGRSPPHGSMGHGKIGGCPPRHGNWTRSKFIKTRLGKHPPKGSRDENDRTDREHMGDPLGTSKPEFPHDVDDFLVNLEGVPPP